jgi:hypothetical protein
MKQNESETVAPHREQTDLAEARTRRPYTPPCLERLGEWSALTLQQSIPIGPGNW